MYPNLTPELLHTYIYIWDYLNLANKWQGKHIKFSLRSMLIKTRSSLTMPYLFWKLRLLLIYYPS